MVVPATAESTLEPSDFPDLSQYPSKSQGIDQQEQSGPTFKVQQFDPFKFCRKCGAPLDATKRCKECRYSQFHATIDGPLEEIPVKLTGFLLYCRNKIGKDLTPVLLTAVYFGVLAIFSLASLVFSVAVLRWFTILLLPFYAVMWVLCALVYFKVRELSTKPAAELAFWQKPLWDLVLEFLRSRGFRSANRNPNPKIVDLREAKPNDNELLLHKDISDATVVILEGAPITDNGLIALRFLPKLRYLVLKQTKVTPEAVFRLQQTIPEAWIWS